MIKILHQEVCYLDGQTRNQIDSILNSYGEILLEDGISQFAIASHVNHEEIFIQKYKLTGFIFPVATSLYPTLTTLWNYGNRPSLYGMGYLFTGDTW